MIDLYRMLSRTIKHYRRRYDADHPHWQDIKSEMHSRLAWNLGSTFFFLSIALTWHCTVQPIQASSFGILLVGIGAVRLALVSARSHMRKFDDSSHHVDAIEDRKTEEYRPRVAGNMVDAVSGFFLVAIGFTIRVTTEFI